MRLSASFCVPLYLHLFTLSNFALLHIEAAEPRVSLTFGSKRDNATSYVSKFANNEGIGFDNEHSGLLAVGYFKWERIVRNLAKTVSDTQSLQQLLNNFHLLAYGNFNDADSGRAVFSKQYNEVGVGKKPYFILLDGVTSYDEAAKAKGFALFSDSSFQDIPYGDIQSPTFYLLLSSMYDEVIEGKVIQKPQDYSRNNYSENYFCTIPIYQTVQTFDAPNGMHVGNNRIDENLPTGTIIVKLSFDYLEGLYNGTPGKVLWDFKPPRETFTVQSSRSNCPITQVRIGAITSEPLLGDDGTVYLGCTNEIYALDGKTESRKWRYSMGRGPSYQTFSLCLAQDGTLYFAASNNSIVALNSSTGTLKWKHQLNDDIKNLHVGGNSDVYVVSQEVSSKHKLSRLSGPDGSEEQLIKSDSPIEVFHISSEAIFFKSSDRIVSLSHEQVKKDLLENNVSAVAMDQDGTIYAVLFDISGNFSLSAIDSSNGSKVWETPMTSVIGRPVIIAKGKLYVLSALNELLSVEKSTGRIVWKRTLDKKVQNKQLSSAVLGKDQILYYTLNDQKIVAFDTLSRLELWEGTLLHAGYSKPVISNKGIVYVGVHDAETSYLRSLTAIQPPNYTANESSYPRTTYQLVSGLGDSGNPNFYILGNLLYAVSPYNFEEQSHFSIRLRATRSNVRKEKVFTIAVNDIAEAPNAINLSQSRFPSNAPNWHRIGALSTVDDDRTDDYKYTILSIRPNDVAFDIVEDQLFLSSFPDTFQTSPGQNYRVEVQVEDSTGLTHREFHTLHKYKVTTSIGNEVIHSPRERPESPSPASLPDSDLDGVPDLLEYALGGSIEDAGKGIPPQRFSKADGKWCLEFIRLKPTLDPDVVISLQMCDDLSSNQWQFVSFSAKGPSNGVDQSGLPDNLPYNSSQYERIQLIPNTPENENLNACFFRILVSTP